jgi:hypothetical protein
MTHDAFVLKYPKQAFLFALFEMLIEKEGERGRKFVVKKLKELDGEVPKGA